jgi:PadR family transcriptional regulator PadR
VLRRLRTAALEDVGDASVYGTLRRLYAAGALTSSVVPFDEAPHRKYYRIKRTAILPTQAKTWASVAHTIQSLLTGGRPWRWPNELPRE